MLSQLVYVSDRVSSSEKDIQDILSACVKNNPSLDITGVLLYSDTKFIQLVEGSYQKIIELYDKIKNDARHERCVMVSLMPIKSRSFPNWTMGSRQLGLNGNGYDFLTELSAEEKKTFENILNGVENQNGESVLDLMEKFFTKEEFA
jgi:hypothetical protein